MNSDSTVTGETLRRLSSSRWLVPLLAAMSGEAGSRFGVLARRLGISRTILSQSLDRLEQWGWVVRNAGHGHPLRPEYLLTVKGQTPAAWCASLMERRLRLRLGTATFGRWSLPILAELTEEARRFSALQLALAPVTPRALSLALDRLQDVSLIERKFDAARYELTDRGMHLAVPLLALPWRPVNLC